MTDDTTTTPDPDVPGDVDVEPEFDETDQLAPATDDVDEPDADSPVHGEETADRFSDPGL